MNALNQGAAELDEMAKRYDDSHMPLMAAFAPNWPIRTVLFRIAGTALVLSASGVWIMDGGQLDPELMLVKLGITVFCFFCGLALLMRNHQDNQPDAYFDPIRGEVRVLQKNDRGRPETVLRRSYDSLGSASFAGKSVTLFDVDGSQLMRLMIDDKAVRSALRTQLGGLVHVTT